MSYRGFAFACLRILFVTSVLACSSNTNTPPATKDASFGRDVNPSDIVNPSADASPVTDLTVTDLTAPETGASIDSFSIVDTTDTGVPDLPSPTDGIDIADAPAGEPSVSDLAAPALDASIDQLSTIDRIDAGTSDLPSLTDGIVDQAPPTDQQIPVYQYDAALRKDGPNVATFDGCSVSSGLCGASSILVMAPHPDDDIITSAGVIERAVRRGDQVHVVYLTNGDSSGIDEGAERQNEAVASQDVLGVSEDNLVFLGYPDGYTEDLRTTYTGPTDVMTTLNGVSHTYAAHGLGRMDYHSYAFGSPGAYNWPNVVGDMATLLGTLLPNAIFVTSGTDGHPDHQSAYLSIVQALPRVFASHPAYKPTIYTTFVWPPDANWPNPPDPTQYFSPLALVDTGLQWSHRNSLDVPLSMQTTTLETNLKYLAIGAEVSQGGNEVGGYIGLFLHKDEFFWGERPADPDNLPPVVNAGFDQTVKGGAFVTLDGSGSLDPEGAALSYGWVQADGPAVALSSPTSARPTFTAPSNLIWPTTFAFELQVADGLGWSIPDAVSVIVNPTTPAPTNVALNATAVASSEDSSEGQTAAKAIDGVLEGYGNGDPTHEWASYREGTGAWIELSWTTPQLVSRIVLHDRPNLSDQVLSGTLLLSDGTTIPVGALYNDGLGNVFDFAPTLITKVRFTVTSVSESTANVGLEEFEVYNVPGGT